MAPLLEYLAGSTFQRMLCAVQAFSLIASARDGPKPKNSESNSSPSSTPLAFWKLWKAESRHRAKYHKLAKPQPPSTSGVFQILIQNVLPRLLFVFISLQDL